VKVIRARSVPDSPARVHAPRRAPVRVGAVQTSWHPDADEHRAALATGVELAVDAGARIVLLQELTLSPYFAISEDATGVEPEALPDGPTHELLASLASRHGVPVHGSLYEAAPDGGLGFNTAVLVAPDGSLLARTRKLHIPMTAGYHEDRYFRPGDTGFPVVDVAGARLGFPTCWDQWFPELARAYSLAGAQVLVYPTAIGSEPDHPKFDTEPLWEQVIRANGITNGTFMVAVNRIGTETVGDTTITFYGSSFVSDPYGRTLVQAPRDEDAVIGADLDLDQRDDWLDLFPFLRTRRPDTYGDLTT
jgi:N-carbamoylputrescine amidase